MIQVVCNRCKKSKERNFEFIYIYKIEFGDIGIFTGRRQTIDLCENCLNDFMDISKLNKKQNNELE